MSSMESFENDSGFVDYAGPLRSEKKSSWVQMSGPLYISRKPEDSFRPIPGLVAHKPTLPTTREDPSTSGVERNGCPSNDYRGKYQHLLKSGQLGMCSDPYCTTCPTYCHLEAQQKILKSSDIVVHRFHNMLNGDAKGGAKSICSFLHPYIPGVMNPHAKIVQKWNTFFAISCLFAVFLDPLFFFFISVQQEKKCIALNWSLAKKSLILRSITDIIYLFHILLQFRLAYVDYEGDLVDHPKKIALHYLLGYFVIDLFAILPLTQIIILLVFPKSIGSYGANLSRDVLMVALFVQYIPRLYRFLPLLSGQSPSGFEFELVWADYGLNFFALAFSSHLVGSCWYLFGLQRVNQCLRDTCQASNIARCKELLECDHDTNHSKFLPDTIWDLWRNSSDATCFTKDGFNYGIYEQAVQLVTEESIGARYVYSLFWGFQQISTLAGNQVPSYFVWEVLFTIAIIGMGLVGFALLIGNMQNFLQSLSRRRLEMYLRRRDIDQLMRRRHLPKELRRRVREAEKYNWAATRGVNEEMLLKSLPQDLHKEIQSHLFKFVKKVRVFALLDEPIIDAICERLRHKTYIAGSNVLYRGGLVDKIVFIIRGKMESIGEDGHVASLCEGDACGEELLTWFLEHSSINRASRGHCHQHHSNRHPTSFCSYNIATDTSTSSCSHRTTIDISISSCSYSIALSTTISYLSALSSARSRLHHH